MHCKPFDAYIAESTTWIKERRANFPAEVMGVDEQTIITANSPFELKPLQHADKNGKYRAGALLIHGLLDCPFSLHDIGGQLQQAGILTRAVLLPGHGTHPSDLLNVTYHDWLATLRYGIESLQEHVENIFLIGYSTGGSLSIHHALHHDNIRGIILLAPALKISAPVSTIVRWPLLANFFSQENKWLCQEKETDYTKYGSVPFQPVIELGHLLTKIKQASGYLTCPMMTIMSDADETVSTSEALRFFSRQKESRNKFILYSRKENATPHDQIEIRHAVYPELRIKHISHVALPFAPNNPHYGQQGDYPDSCSPLATDAFYGAYNRLELKLYHQLYKYKLIKNRRISLSYNPDFSYMTGAMVKWMELMT